MRKLLILALLCAIAMLATACGDEQESEQGTEASDPAQAEQADAEESDSPQAADTGKSIVVYFSRVGNTDFPKNVDAVSSASLQKDGGKEKE